MQTIMAPKPSTKNVRWHLEKVMNNGSIMIPLLLVAVPSRFMRIGARPLYSEPLFRLWKITSVETAARFACGGAASVSSSLAMAAAHILLVSLPAPGHIFPFTSFAYQLAAAGAQVTCFTTGYVFEHLQHRGVNKYTNQSSSSSSTGRIRFEGLLEYQEVPEVILEDVMQWCQALSNEEMGAALERRFLELQPPPCCIVSDMLLEWVHDVAAKLRVPRHTLFTMPAKDLAFALRVPELFERGELPFNAAGATERHILLPGMTSILAEDVCRSLTDCGHAHHQEFKKCYQRLGKSSTIVVNTFEELEAETFKALGTDYVAANIKVPEILPILLSNIPRMQRHGSNSTDREDPVSEVENWLDTQAPASVIYISFGSLVTLAEKKIEALALALEAANYPFVWVYRPPGIPQVSRQTNSHSATHRFSLEEYFPPGFQGRVSGRAMLINGWAPQPQILTHDAVGAFLTHCGWNSTLESVCAGVPMLCWPFWADQKINARFITDTAQVGLRIHRNEDDTVNQDAIEKVLKQMMEGNEGKVARSKALKFQLLAQKDVADGGASRTNLDKFVHQCVPNSSCHGSCGC